MKTLTEHFKINKTQHEIDFVNVDAIGDTKLFINPTLLKYSTDKSLSENGAKKVESFFLEIFKLYSSGKRSTALELFTSSGETNANHLGYSQGRSRGNGASEKALSKLFDTILSSGALAEEIMVRPVSLLVFVHDFGEDRMSDLVTSILKRCLVNYTLRLAKEYGITIEDNEISYGNFWNEETCTWEEFKDLWIKGADGKPVLFTPKQIVSEKFGFSVRDYVTQVVWHWRKDYHLSNRTSLVSVKYDKNGDPVYKAPSNDVLQSKEIDEVYQDEEGKWKLYALDMTIKNPNLFKQYLDRFTKDRVSGKNQILTDDELIQIVKDK